VKKIQRRKMKKTLFLKESFYRGVGLYNVSQNGRVVD
jgi:hypothetical protein